MIIPTKSREGSGQYRPDLKTWILIFKKGNSKFPPSFTSYVLKSWWHDLSILYFAFSHSQHHSSIIYSINLSEHIMWCSKLQVSWIWSSYNPAASVSQRNTKLRWNKTKTALLLELSKRGKPFVKIHPLKGLCPTLMRFFQCCFITTK